MVKPPCKVVFFALKIQTLIHLLKVRLKKYIEWTWLNISTHQRTRLVLSISFILFVFHFYDVFFQVNTLAVVHLGDELVSMVNTRIGPWQDLESIGKVLVREGVNNA